MCRSEDGVRQRVWVSVSGLHSPSSPVYPYPYGLSQEVVPTETFDRWCCTIGSRTTGLSRTTRDVFDQVLMLSVPLNVYCARRMTSISNLSS